MANIVYLLPPQISPHTKKLDFWKAFIPEHHLYISSYKTLDENVDNNITFFGVSDKMKIKGFFGRYKKHFFLLLNLIFFPYKKDMDVFYSPNKERYSGVLAIIFAKLYKKKSVVRLAGNLFNSYKYKTNIFNKYISYFINNIIAVRILKHADRIISLNFQARDYLISYGANPDKTYVVMNSIDYKSQSSISPTKKPDNLSKDKKNVFFAGRMVRRKGVESIIKLLEDKKITDNYFFIFAGEDIHGYSKELNKYESSIYLGQLSKQELFNYYNYVDLFLFPAFSEGFPKVISEAFSTGCPIVCRNMGSGELLADYSFDTDEELKDIMLNGNFVRKQKVDWPKEFEWDYIKSQYLSVINEVLKD